MKPEMTIELFNSYHKQLVFFIKSLVGDEDDAYDVASGCFEKIMSLDFKHINDARYFLFRLGKNEALNFLKHRNYTKRGVIEFNSEDFADAKLIKSEIIQWLNEKRLKLPEQRRAIFDLLFLEHLSTNEIASKLNLSVDTIRVQKARICKEFKIFQEKRYKTIIHANENGKTYQWGALKGSKKDPYTRSKTTQTINHEYSRK